MKKSFNRKSLLLPLLLLVTGSAWAGWEKVSETDISNFYADKATIRKDGNLRRMWEVQDLKQRGKDGEISFRMKNEYDCKGERYRILAGSSHTEPMVGGKTISSFDSPSGWTYIPPGTASEARLRIACAQ